MRWLVLTGLMLCAGCSITQPHPDLVRLSADLRLSGGVDISAAHRWVLPPLTRVALHTGEGGSQAYAEAAIAGLANALQVSDAAAWHLIVHWPQDQVETGAEEAARWRKWLPKPAGRQVLVVDVVDASRTHWVQRLQVDVKPWLFGRDWRDEAAIERTFAAVGRALTGS